MDPRIIELYNDYVHSAMPRRRFFGRLIALTGSVAGASAAVALVEPNHAAARQVAEDDARLITGYEFYAGSQGDVRAYVARPAGGEVLPGVVVIHENRGLNAHIEDVARRTALAGYVAVAPDGLSVAGGAPADQEQARDLFASTERTVIDADVIAAVPYLGSRDDCNGRLGVVGFCYGGHMALRCAAEHDRIAAAVCFYGTGLPDDQVARIRGAVELHYAGDDPRVNAGIPELRQSLDAHRIPYSLHMYPGTQHGFHNDASAARYDADAAGLAWQRTQAFLGAHLRDA